MTFPLIARALYNSTGALIPMLCYYGLAWGIVKWRRGSTGYFNKMPEKIPMAFYALLGVVSTAITCAYFAPVIAPEKNILGVVLTASLWAPINGASEQLLWIYIFESWDLYPNPDRKRQKIIFRVIGLVLFLAFIGLIHALFWGDFLHTIDTAKPLGMVSMVMVSISAPLYLVVWRKSNQMVFTFIPHFMLNLIVLFWTYYSILPYLFAW